VWERKQVLSGREEKPWKSVWEHCFLVETVSYIKGEHAKIFRSSIRLHSVGFARDLCGFRWQRSVGVKLYRSSGFMNLVMN